MSRGEIIIKNSGSHIDGTAKIQTVIAKVNENDPLRKGQGGSRCITLQSMCAVR